MIKNTTMNEPTKKEITLLQGTSFPPKLHKAKTGKDTVKNNTLRRQSFLNLHRHFSRQTRPSTRTLFHARTGAGNPLFLPGLIYVVLHLVEWLLTLIA